MKAKAIIAGFATTAFVAGLAATAQAAINVDGTLDADYGAALATQTVNTGFGDSTVGDGTSAGGSELDAGYGVVQGGNLYIMLTGNFEANVNRVNVFISDGRSGQSTLAVPATGNMQAMNGSLFSPGFSATLAMDFNDYAGTAFVEEYSLVGSPSGGYVGSFGLTGGIGTGSPGGSIVSGLNNLTAAGVNGSAPTAASAAAADAVTTGLEIAIPLSLLGNPTSGIMVLADINGNGDTYLSNQFLPGLPVGSGNVGTSGFNFGSTSGEYFTVPVPEPTTAALLGLAGLATVIAARNRK